MTTFSISQQKKTFILSISGRLDAKGASVLWHQIPKNRSLKSATMAVLDLENIDYMDTAGAAFLCHLETHFADQGVANIRLKNIKPDHLQLLETLKKIKEKAALNIHVPQLSYIERKGKQFEQSLADTKEFITCTGQITWAMLQSFRHPGKIRWADTFAVAERSGVDALPIVALISFIVGLVMAFQAAIPMRMFGAELYVANLIGISMVRELGPLMTAIVLAGRSSSAFAAEIGTMRINEEIDALSVMGLDPVRFLIVPKIIATTFITPLLTIFSNLMGMLGGALVITSMGYPIVSYYNQIASFVEWNDFAGGLVKCFVFGMLIAATGCIRGYQTSSGPSAVGESTTRAVVTGIVLIAVFDGIFSIIYYCLGI
ncbi:MAG: MlaE family lipid ABC transporter permease subunit [Desulfobacula sp.]|nr:MlaE family lipid ABC transporter permease subunit [Desulfobacula sp.]